jgi:Family of unknown function (DUF6879)
MLDLSQLSERINGFARTAFRLETLDLYSSGSDGGDVARYLRGEPAPDPARKEPWLARLRDERASGKLRQRVHVLRSPLSPYLRYECEWGYAYNAPFEDIRILDLAERAFPPGLIADHDFWLIDDQDLIIINYDDGGRFASAEIAAAAELPRYQAARSAALAAAEPFLAYWRRHTEYHQENNRAA